ncbi:cytochrome D ubiquinol oxidase subunit II [Virgisporangium aliadipatigenens]|uniref:Cytochrome D ubiquinol oxidase subunit II n=1 Tax=Virgisporangium aliadipatigenens TaxID=741659 RepID=A0A8J3YM20_9ACTN|nr:cytochrome d ubiquinol oxidase subunit II [Virgisporangium aliadipatigenens]GIJ47686.1 cytochrome D ubiquinol oxidase subunit II [Virgisporangium aliadipatigenens]
MTAADLLLLLLLAAMTAYALFGGADFGAGFWDLVAGGAERGRPHRKLIEHSIGPVWEANHVWLIFTIVVLWTGFPSVFAAVASTLYIPLTAAALGIIGRGAGFAFRKTSVTLGRQRLFGAGFAFSSIVTPFFLGAAAGGVASGRVPPGIAAGDLVSSWWNPTSVATGLLAVGVGAYLAVVFLTRDAQKHAPELVDGLRRRALWTGAVVGALAVLGLVVVAADAPALFSELRHGVPLALVVVSLVAGLLSLLLVNFRSFVAVRITASLAAAAVVWAWGAAQHPFLLPGLAVADAAAAPAVTRAMLWVSLAGGVILAPSLWWLFRIASAGSVRS